MFNRLQHSLSAKLIVLFICTGAVLVLLIGLIVAKSYSRHYRSSIQPFMVHYVELMQQQLGSPPNFEKAIRITQNIPVDIHVYGPIENWSTAQTQLDLTNLVKASDAESSNELSQFRLTRVAEDVLLHTQDGEYHIYFQIHEKSNIRSDTEASLFILFSILGVLLLTYYATRTIFNPIQDIEQGVKQFGIGNFHHKILKRRNDQLGDLTDSVNQMGDNIQQMLEAKREFLLGVSHELRSPLTRSKVNLALMQDSDTKREIDNDITAMAELITEMLESERLNSPHRVIHPEPTQLNSLIEEVIAVEFNEQSIVTDIWPVSAEVDHARIKLLVRNLLQNALKYSSQGTNPHITLRNEIDHFLLIVEDFGKGISPKHIPFLTEPFYRADHSRRRKTGGYGLGLYLCRMIVQAHSGQIFIDSTLDKGTKITCRFPLISTK